MILYELLTLAGFRPVIRRLYRLEVEGAGHIPAGGPGIIASNHESLLDPFVLAAVTPRKIRFMAKAELFAWPVLKQAMHGFGTFPVERGRSDARAIGLAGDLLARGELLGIFPQGTCLPFRERPFRRGAARLALATGAPLVPVALVGTERALRPRRPKLGLPRLRVIVAPPLLVDPQEPTPEAATVLTERLEAIVNELRAPFGPPAHAWYPPGRTRR